VKVALTFDAEHPDRPNCAPGTADAILDALAERAVRATFFMQGRWVEAYPATARRAARDGHLVASHSHHHAPMPLLGSDGVLRDVRAAERAIEAVTGADPRPWFRCPWGLGWDDPVVLDALAHAGYRHAGWNVEVHDWEPSRSPDHISDDVVRGVLHPRSAATEEETIVLLHSWPEQNREAVPAIVDALLAAGAEFVGVDDLRTITVEAIESWDGAP
jgi:peptidoglycan/xylan/chitin deacetylase (PgdA/CDA1 family)